MANPFDQFDADTGQVNPFDKFDAPKPAPMPPTLGREGDGAPPRFQFMPKGMNLQMREPGMLDTAADIARTIPSSLVKGALGVGSMPGNLEYIARLGIDKASSALGYGDPGFSQPKEGGMYDGRATIMPTYSDYRRDLEQRTGVKLYDPKTTPGKYVGTVAEFVPAVMGGGGGLAGRAAAAVVPGVASETAGQLTQGTALEPWARAAGALVTPRAAMRTVTPLPATPARAANVAALEAEGVNALTAGQRTGNRPLQWIESSTADMPFGGNRAAEMLELQGEQFTAAALRRGGIQNEVRATPEVIDQAFTRIGHEFDAVAMATAIPMTQQIQQRMGNIARQYEGMTAPSLVNPLPRNIAADASVMRIIDGPQYLRWRSDLGAAARTERNPGTQRALYDLMNELDDAAEAFLRRSRQPEMVDRLREARSDYRNMMVIEKAATGAGERAAEGIISPAKLREATVATHGRRNYARGDGDFPELARAGVGTMTPLPQSGTSPRAHAAGMLHAGAGLAGYGAAGPLGAAAALVGPPLAARAIMSPSVQAYLGNQLLTGAINAVPRNALASTIQRETVVYDENRRRNALAR